MQLITTTGTRQVEGLESKLSSKDIVTLQPLAMRIPNSYGIYSPSKLRPKKEIGYEEFLSRYADHPIEMRVCLDENPDADTLLQRSELVTAYGFGWDCWYIISPKNESSG